MIKYTIDQLQKMSLRQISALDISSPLEEKMIQEIILSKQVNVTPVVQFNTRLVPDIKSPQDEKIWQEKIDKFNEAQKPVEAKIAEATQKLQEVKADVQALSPQIVEPTVTPTVITVDNAGQIVKPFCDKCPSKGVRHRKECPLYVPFVAKTVPNTI